MRSRRRQEDRRASRRRQDFNRGSLNNVSVDRLLLGKTGQVFGEYQIVEPPTERQTVKGDNYLIFNICDVNPIGFKAESTICMKIWQSDNLNDELIDGLQEEDARIRLIGVKCSLYQNTPQLTLNGDFRDGRIQLVNTGSSPSKLMYGNGPLFGNSSHLRNPFDGKRKDPYDEKHEVPFNPYPLSYPPIMKPLSATDTLVQTPKTTGKKRARRGDSSVPPALKEMIEKLGSSSRVSRPLKRKKRNRKQVIFEQGKKMGITLKPETFLEREGAGNQFISYGKGAKVVKCDRDRTLIGMVIYEINGDSSIRNKPLREIKGLLATKCNVGPVRIIFGPSVNLKDDSSQPFSLSTGLKQRGSQPSTPTIQKTTHSLLSTPPPVSSFFPKAAECKGCSDLAKQVENLKKRVELLEGKAPVRKLTNDDLEDLLENTESVTTRVRRELAKRAKEPRAECNICMDAKPNQTFVPCGHCVCCEKCANTLSVCPLCRQKITQKIKSYFG